MDCGQVKEWEELAEQVGDNDGIHAHDDNGEVVWLRDVVGRTEFEAPDHVRRTPFDGHENNDDVAGTRVSFDLLTHFISADVRHADIKQDKIDIALGAYLERFRARVDHHGFIAVRLKALAQNRGRLYIVIGHAYSTP